MNTYYYQVVLKKHIEVIGSSTITDITGRTQTQPCKILLPPTSEIITGYVRASDEQEAHTNAKQELEKLYPYASGYREHEHVKVKKIEEKES